MTSTTPRSWAEEPPALDVILSCAVLFVLAVAQPLLDLLGRNAEFFLARATPPVDIVLLALLLTFGIPVFIGLFVAGVRNLHAPTGTVLHWIVLSILGASSRFRSSRARRLPHSRHGWRSVSPSASACSLPSPSTATNHFGRRGALPRSPQSWFSGCSSSGPRFRNSCSHQMRSSDPRRFPSGTRPPS